MNLYLLALLIALIIIPAFLFTGHWKLMIVMFILLGITLFAGAKKAKEQRRKEQRDDITEAIIKADKKIQDSKRED